MMNRTITVRASRDLTEEELATVTGIAGVTVDGQQISFNRYPGTIQANVLHVLEEDLGVDVEEL